MEDDTGFTGPPKGNALVALHRCVQGCASQPFQPAFPGQSQFPGQVVQVALQAIPPIGEKIFPLSVAQMKSEKVNCM